MSTALSPPPARTGFDEIRRRHALAAVEQQASDILSRLTYSGDLAAVALNHGDLDGFLYWFLGLKQDVGALTAVVREMRDGRGR